MKDFIKERMTFALALLGVVLALHPFAMDPTVPSFSIFTIKVQLKYFYFAFGCFLGLSVYFYSLQFIKLKQFSFTENFGGYCFIIALSLPAVYLFALCLNWLVILISYLSQSEILRTVISGIGIFMAFASTLIWFVVARREMNSRQKEGLVTEEEKTIIPDLLTAEKLIEAGFYDTSILHSFNAIMTSLRNYLLKYNFIDKSVPDFQTLQIIKSKKIFSNEIMSKIHEIRLLRNQVAHAREDSPNVSPDLAKEFLALANDVIKKTKERPFVGGSPCQMSGQKCPSCNEGIMDVASIGEGVECDKCGLFISAG